MPSQLENDLNEWVTEQLSVYEPRSLEPRRIQDSVHGQISIDKAEVQIVDSPIVQRLRRISQLGLASLLYPGGTHTRFEHSLGMFRMAREFVTHLRESEPDGEKKVDEERAGNILAAAILHDIGHGPFSHAAEAIMERMPDIMSVRGMDGKVLHAKPHEVLSYMIVKSNRFREFLSKIQHRNYDADVIAGLIIGQVKDPRDQWMADIINGFFDADKMDYMRRDSYYTGIRLDVDFSRVIEGTRIYYSSDGKHKLVIVRDSMRSMEQFEFNKLVLYQALYHHHTVRAVDRQVESLLEWWFDEHEPISSIQYKTAASILRLTDNQLLCVSESNGANVNETIERIRRRTLFKRSIVLGPLTIEPETKTGWDLLLNDAAYDRNKLYDLRGIITSDMGLNRVQRHDVWLDIPISAANRELLDLEIEVLPRVVKRYKEVSPAVEGRLIAYSEGTEEGHGFIYEGKDAQGADLRDKMYKVLVELLSREYHIKLNTYAHDFARHTNT